MGKQKKQTESALYAFAEYNKHLENDSPENQISVMYSFEDLVNDAKKLVKKTNELVEMTEDLVGNTLKLIDKSNKEENGKVSVYVEDIKKMRKMDNKKPIILTRHRHGKSLSPQKHKKRMAHNKGHQNKITDDYICTEEKVSSGKTELQVN